MSQNRRGKQINSTMFGKVQVQDRGCHRCSPTMQLTISLLLMALVGISAADTRVFRADRCNTNANRLDNWLGRRSAVQSVATTPPESIAANTTFSQPGESLHHSNSQGIGPRSIHPEHLSECWSEDRCMAKQPRVTGPEEAAFMSCLCRCPRSGRSRGAVPHVGKPVPVCALGQTVTGLKAFIAWPLKLLPPCSIAVCL